MIEQRLVIAVGGTGGHVYPAVSLAKKLIEIKPTLLIDFIGGGLSKNRYFDHGVFPHHEIPARRKPWSIAKGVWKSFRFLNSLRPSCIVGFGSYYTLPILFAAKCKGIPLILHEQNAVPGRVNRYFSKYAQTTGVFLPEAKKYLAGSVLEVEYPLREWFDRPLLTQREAKKYYGFSPDQPLALVFGGSQGAQAINHLFAQASELGGFPGLQVLHFTGDAQLTKQLRSQYRSKKTPACVKDYENRMELAWQAADVVVSRAGAGTLAEQLSFQVPGILIPYPYAMDQHQEKNADFMEKIVGGAIKRTQAEYTPEALVNDLKRLVETDTAAKMQQKMSKFLSERRVKNFTEVVLDTIEKGNDHG